MEILFPNLGLNLKNVPMSFELSGISVTCYGLITAIAMLAALIVILITQRKSRGTVNDSMGLFVTGTLGALIGARLFYVIINFSLYEKDILKILRIRDGGLDAFGGLVCGLVACLLYCAVRKIRFSHNIDPIVLGLTMFQAIQSLGLFFMRTGFGEYNDNLLAMQLPLASVNSAEVTTLMRENLVESNGSTYIRVTPLFLCELAGCLVIFLFLLGVHSSRIYSGAVFELYLALYGILHAGMLFLKRYEIPEIRSYDGVTFIISLLCFVIFGIVFCIRSVMARKRNKLSLAYQKAQESEEDDLEE